MNCVSFDVNDVSFFGITAKVEDEFVYKNIIAVLNVFVNSETVPLQARLK